MAVHDEPRLGADRSAPPVFRVEKLAVRYGGVRAVRDVDFTVAPGAAVALIGHNGAGKSSALQALAGFIKSAGRVELFGDDISSADARRRIAHGLSLVPEGWGVLRELSVGENLRLFADAAPREAAARAWPRERIYDLFPILWERDGQLAGLLSGGERQMLSIACSLEQGPRLLMLDEPTAGLSPAMTEAVWEVCDVVRSEGIATVIVAQEVERILELVDHVLVMQSGELVLDAPNGPQTKDECRQLLGFGIEG